MSAVERVEHLRAVAHDRHALRQREHFVEPVRDEQNRDVAFAQLCARSQRAARLRAATSAAVGSSMISTFAFSDSALAISITC